MSPPTVVVDASVLIDALTSDEDAGHRARKILSGAWLAAPEHVTVETFSGIRGRQLGGKLDPDRTERALDRLERVELQIVHTRLLLRRMWELRANLTTYDAAYVAAAERLGVPLVTGDLKLAAATGPRCEFVVP